MQCALCTEIYGILDILELEGDLLSPSYSISSEYHKSQTVRPRDLKFLDDFHHPRSVTCHVSHVTCQMFFFVFFYKVVELVGRGSVIDRAYA